jgi:hypothetical protein
MLPLSDSLISMQTHASKLIGRLKHLDTWFDDLVHGEGTFGNPHLDGDGIIAVLLLMPSRSTDWIFTPGPMVGVNCDSLW